MKAGLPSRTAIWVAFYRAAAQGNTPIRGFADPFAEQLLPPDYLRRVTRLRRRPDGFWMKFLQRSTRHVTLRSVAIDEEVRQALAVPDPPRQLVILGAGLDSRAWRMPELFAATVFEVDHPATQGYKRERIAGAKRKAREVRFVTVDFEKDSLEARLAEAGFDPKARSLWIWEGVVMYLEKPVVEANLTRIASLCAPGSRLLVYYQSKVRGTLVSLVVRRAGEPFRSAFTAPEMAAMLQRTGFTVRKDEDAGDWARRFLPAPQADGVKRVSRLATAEVGSVNNL